MLWHFFTETYEKVSDDRWKVKKESFSMFLWIVRAHGNCKQVAGVSEIERVSRTSEYICYIHAETFIVVLCLTVFSKNLK